MHQTFTETSPSGNPGFGGAFNLVWQDGGEATSLMRIRMTDVKATGWSQGAIALRYRWQGWFPYPSRIDDRCPHGESETRRSSDQADSIVARS